MVHSTRQSSSVWPYVYLALVTSFSIASSAQERWLYDQTRCLLNPFFAMYFYLIMVLHLVAVSSERYKATVRSPLTYDGMLTKSTVVVLLIISAIPIPFSWPFPCAGTNEYNAELFFCEQGWSVQSDSSERNAMFVFIPSFVLPFLVILFLNWSGGL